MYLAFVAIILIGTNVHFFTHKNTGVLKLFCVRVTQRWARHKQNIGNDCVILLSVEDKAEKTLRAFALFYEVKSAVVARLFEGAARVSQPQALKPME